MSYQEDVRFVSAFARGGNWELGLRIARNVSKGMAAATPRVSQNQFAKDTGLSVRSVGRYYEAWERAAADKVVDPADTL